MADNEIKDRFALNYYFKPTLDPQFVKSQERAIWRVRYINGPLHTRQANRLFGVLGLGMNRVDPPLGPPKEAIDGVIKRHDYLRQFSFAEASKRYRVDYIFWDTIQESEWILPQEFDIVYESGGIKILKVPQ